MALEAWDKLVGAVRSLTTPSDTQPVDLRRGLSIGFKPISVLNSGGNVIVAADATRKIKVLEYVLVSEGTCAVTWRSHINPGTDLTGPMPLIVNTGVAAGGGNAPGSHWEFETNVNEDLVLVLSVQCGVRGHMTYFLEP